MSVNIQNLESFLHIFTLDGLIFLEFPISIEDIFLYISNLISIVFSISKLANLDW